MVQSLDVKCVLSYLLLIFATESLRHERGTTFLSESRKLNISIISGVARACHLKCALLDVTFSFAMKGGENPTIY